jgi:hypothetical protein
MATTAVTVWNSLYTAFVSSLEGTTTGKFRKIIDGYFDPLSAPVPVLGIEVIDLAEGMQIGDEVRTIMRMKIRIAYPITASRPNQTALTQIGYVKNFLDSVSVASAFKFKQEQEWSISNPPDTDAPAQIGTCESLFGCEVDVTRGSN